MDNSKIPDNVLNPKLYKKAKEKATQIYGSKSSAYRSMFIVSEYKKMGGKYSGSRKEAKKGGVSKWIKEQWVQVIPYLKENKIIACGDSSAIKKGCRPLIRINDKTPITIKELLKIHSKDKLIELAEKKKKNMDLRINWKAGKIYK